MTADHSEAQAYRPWRQIERRKSRQIKVGKVPVGGDAPITVQSMTNTLTTDAKATIAQIRQLEEAGADIVRVSCPDEGSTAALKDIVQAVEGADRRRHPFPLQARHRGGESGAACLRINPGNIGSPRARAGSRQGGQGSRLLDAHRRQCRLAGAGSAGEIRRALPRGDGRKRAEPRQDPRGPRLLRVQDQREGVRRVPRRRRLSGTGRGLRLSARISASPRPAACAPAR